MFISRQEYEKLFKENCEMRIKIEMLEKQLAEKPTVVEKIVEKVVEKPTPAVTLNPPVTKKVSKKRPVATQCGDKIFYNGNTTEYVQMGQAEPGHGEFKRYSISVMCCGHHMLGNYYHEPDTKADNRMGWAYLRDTQDKNDIPGWPTYYAKIVDACRLHVEGHNMAADLDNEELPFA